MGTTIRDACLEDAAGIARVHVDSWKTTYRGIVPDDVLNRLSYAQREEWRWNAMQRRTPGAFSLAAADEAGKIVGFADAGPERGGDPDFRGEIYAIYLLQEFQGRGVGRLLFDEIVRRLTEAGFNSMLVWVLEDNPTREFYEHMGGRPVHRKNITLGTELIEIGYGWDDLQLCIREGQED